MLCFYNNNIILSQIMNYSFIRLSTQLNYITNMAKTFSLYENIIQLLNLLHKFLGVKKLQKANYKILIKTTLIQSFVI